MSIIDYHTRYLTLAPVSSKQADAVTRAFGNSFVAYFGPPRHVTTDNGTEFTGRPLEEMCQALNITHGYTIPYHPKANGMVERTNRVVRDTLYDLTEERPYAWPDYLPQVQLTINSAMVNIVILYCMGFPIGT